MSLSFFSLILTPGQPEKALAPEGYCLNLTSFTLVSDSKSLKKVYVKCCTGDISGEMVDTVLGVMRPNSAENLTTTLVFGWDMPLVFSIDCFTDKKEAIKNLEEVQVHVQGYYQPFADGEGGDEYESEGDDSMLDYDSMDSSDLDSDSDSESDSNGNPNGGSNMMFEYIDENAVKGEKPEFVKTTHAFEVYPSDEESSDEESSDEEGTGEGSLESGPAINTSEEESDDEEEDDSESSSEEEEEEVVVPEPVTSNKKNNKSAKNKSKQFQLNQPLEEMAPPPAAGQSKKNKNKNVAVAPAPTPEPVKSKSPNGGSFKQSQQQQANNKRQHAKYNTPSGGGEGELRNSKKGKTKR